MNKAEEFDCPYCGIRVEMIESKEHSYTPIDKKLVTLMEEYKIPFTCPCCGGLRFPCKAIRDLVFIYPKKVPMKIGLIHIPETVRKNLEQEQEYGLVLSIGKGYWRKNKHFIPSSEIKVGDEVIYDKQTPWIYYMKYQGKTYKVKYMGYQDVKVLVTK